MKKILFLMASLMSINLFAWELRPLEDRFGELTQVMIEASSLNEQKGKFGVKPGVIEEYTLVATLPEEVKVEEDGKVDVGIKIDDNKPIIQKWQLKKPNIIVQPYSKKIIDLAKKGDSLKFSVYSKSGKNMLLLIELMDFKVILEVLKEAN